MAGQALAQTDSDQAMKLLHDALRQGDHDAKPLQKDEALAPLRTRADFQRLVQELEAKGK